MANLAFCGPAFHAPTRDAVDIVERALIVVRDGVISEVTLAGDEEFDRRLADASEREGFHLLEEGQYLIPGFVDLHNHAPQWPQMGKALDVPLEIWLQKYTFPLEAKYSDVAFASMVYTDLVEQMLAHGTTTAVYFATVHLEASLELARICVDKGQRAFVGKVSMDNSGEVLPYYRDASSESAISDTRKFIARVRELSGNASHRVEPIITPRFVPSCTDALLEGLGELSRECRCTVQTHCAESDWERDYVFKRFGKTDPQVLDDFGLLREGTVLAHSNYITEDDQKLIRSREAAIAHCPLSNYYFSDAVFPLRRALDAGLRIGLGTDISGGHSPSLFDGVRSAVASGRILEHGVDPALSRAGRGVENSSVSIAESFWLATRGGAQAIGLNVGDFSVGREFDAMLIDTSRERSSLRVWHGLDTSEDILSKILLNATRENIRDVWVAGRRVAGA